MRILLIILLFSTNVFGQAEIFRIVSGGSGWEWYNGSSWAAMTLYNGDGIADITADGGTYEGYVFENTGATNNGHPVQVSGDNVTFRNCIIKNSRNVGIRGVGSNNLLIENCFFYDLGIGTWISSSTGVRVNSNWFLNMKYDRADPANGSARSGQSVFFESVNSAGNEINDNRIESNFGEAYNEDHINTYASGGTSGDSLKGYRNLIRGGQGSYTGGGMIIGDNGSDYVHYSNNRLVNPGWYGMQVYGGANCSAVYNYLYQDFTLSPTQLPWSRVGFLIYNGTGTCTGMQVNTTNVVRYRRGDHGNPADFNGASDNATRLDDGCGWGSCCTSSIGGHSITHSTTLTPANMPMPDGTTGFPDHLIDCVSVDDYWKIRSGTFLDADIVNSYTTSVGTQNAPDVNARRPTANAGSDQSISISSATLTSSSSIATGGVGTFTLSAHSWTQVSGPNTSTIVSPTSSSTSITGLITGTYIFRYIVEQENSIYELKTYQADWVQVTVSITANGVKMPIKFAAINDPVNYKHNWASR